MRPFVNAALVAARRTFLPALLLLPVAALAFGGQPHWWAGRQAGRAFDFELRGNLAPPNKPEGPLVQRNSPIPFFPEITAISYSYLEGGSHESGLEGVPIVPMLNWEIYGWNAQREDDYNLVDWEEFGCPAATPATLTIRHFWDSDIGGALGQTAGPFRDGDLPAIPDTPELCPDPLILANADLYPNAWNQASIFWRAAIDHWSAPAANDEERMHLQGWAYFYLGHAAHLLMDMGQPAHTHEDMHNDSDALERAFACGDRFYSWFDPGTGDNPLNGLDEGVCDPEVFRTRLGKPARSPGFIPRPGDLLYPPPADETMLRLITTFFEGSTGRYADPILLGNDPWFFVDQVAGYPYNLAQAFYLFHVVNQIGDYYPSDAGDGDTSEASGWLQQYAGFPLTTEGGDPIWSMANLENHEDPSSDDDGVIFQIMTGLTRDQFEAGEFGHYGGYQAAFMGAYALLDLFRRTVDGVPPVTEFSVARRDGKPVSPGWNDDYVVVTVVGATDHGRPGKRPSGLAGVLGRCEGVDHRTGGSWTLGDGKHVVQGLSYDWTGAVDDSTDVVVWVDRTAPAIELLGLEPVYLTSEVFVPRWTATDPLSGVDATWADLDGTPVLDGQEIDLALLAGLHTLTVRARDEAGNEGWVEHHFEVLIDAQAWSKPDELNAKSNGSLHCFVEFPVPYDVGLVDLATVRLTVNGTMLSALGITPGMDGDKDDLADRMVRFDAEAFSAAAQGQAGSVAATLTGRLLGGELTPGFTATCTVPLFTPGS